MNICLGIWRVDAVHRLCGSLTLFREHEGDALDEVEQLHAAGWRCDAYVTLLESRDLTWAGRILVAHTWPNERNERLLALARGVNRRLYRSAARKQGRDYRTSLDKARADLAALRVRKLNKPQADED